MRRLLIPAAVFLSLAVPTAADANYFLGEAVDPGPISSMGDVDLARDGTGAIAYIKAEGGVDHVFMSRFSGGRFGPPERLDNGLNGASSQAVVGASDNGRLLVAYVNDGLVYGVVKPRGDNPVSAPTPLGGGTLPSADLSINGTGYVSFTSNGDVRVARLDRRTNGWTLLPQPLDVDPAREAGVGTNRSRVAVSADGIGLVTWGEAGHVFARKMFNAGLSTAPQDLTPADLGGRAATTSDLPELDVEDDSSYGWVVFRQRFADGGSRILARRQRGTGFEPPVAVDSGDDQVTSPKIDMNGRGVSLAASSGVTSNQPMSAATKNDAFFSGSRWSAPGTLDPVPAPVMAENNDGLVASVASPAGSSPFVRVRPYEESVPRAELTLSRPELGPVDPTLGFDAATDRGFGVVVAWAQGDPGKQQLVAGLLDRPPASFTGNTAQRCCRAPKVTLSWAASFDLWGATKYQVFVDNKLVGETTQTKLALPAPLTSGSHRWQVAAIDTRGQTKRTKTRLVRIDATRPRLSVSYKRKKRIVTLSARGRDVGSKTSTSGMKQVRVSWGDGSRSTGVSRAGGSHRYRKTGSFKLVVTATDKAGNQTVNRRTVRIGGK